VILSVFLRSPVENPDALEEILRKELPQTFTQAGVIRGRKLNITYKPGSGEIKASSSENESAIGFEVQRSVDGRVEWLVRGVNEPTRFLISVHSTTYQTWEQFQDRCVKVFNAIFRHRPNLPISGIVLTYIDIFDWKEASFPPLKLIFQNDSELIPLKCLSLQFPWEADIRFVEESQNPAIRELMPQRIQMLGVEVSTEDAPSSYSKISIKHSVALPVHPDQELKTLLSGGLFAQAAYDLHMENKKILQQILTIPVLELIGITSRGEG
jgi:uncharacterized protein (TIGR04255 family)